ncbi:hypothetical protein WH95_13490, partial [Kiloniella litopenaei]
KIDGVCQQSEPINLIGFFYGIGSNNYVSKKKCILRIKPPNSSGLTTTNAPIWLSAGSLLL